MKQIKNLAWMSAIALAGTMTFAACSSDDDKVENINPTYDGKSVKTQFAINVPVAHKTRQGVDIVQGQTTPVFRGMQDVKLFSATATPNDATTQNEIALVPTISSLESTTNHKIYSDVVVPVGTSNFLFYGQATVGSNTNASNGFLEMSTTSGGTGTLANISFDLQPISNTGIPTGTGTDGKELLGILNGIAQVENWSSLEGNTDLGVAYNNFTQLTSGSAPSVLKAVQLIYDKVKGAADGVGAALKSKIEESFIVTNPAAITYDTSIFPNTTFPENLGLPQGAARLTFNSTNKEFSYTNSTVIGISSINPATICYPAALYYFANSTLGANDETVMSWPTTFEGWTNYFNSWNSAVRPTTKTIALKERINYGVAMLKTTVKTSGNLQDNSQSLGGLANDKDIFILGSNKFTLTGVLIGGQPAAAKWDFTPKSSDPTEYNYTIWDSQMATTTEVGAAASMDVTTTACSPNYTMVLDNSNTTHQTVNIAIELVNNVGDFYGIDGLIPNGAKFYLAGQLNPTSGTGASVNDVFLQDYTTTANLTITSLKNAYMTIPDLRSTKLQLGLAVDLSWKSGLTFNVELGGN